MQSDSPSRNVLPVASLIFSSTLLLVALASCPLIVLKGNRIPYDSNLVPMLALGQIVLCLLAVAVSFGAILTRTNWCSITSLLVGTVSVVVSALAFVLLMGVMLANHPV